MGQGCRYCTLWADGLNGFVPHLEETLALVMLSKDSPEVQRTMANSRGWRFKRASHLGGVYIEEQGVGDSKNGPGIVCYTKDKGKIYRKNASVFGPGDLYCSIWPILNLAGLDASSWTPQYSYWQRPHNLEDGGKNVK